MHRLAEEAKKVCVCACVGVWVCGCVGVWVCGCAQIYKTKNSAEAAPRAYLIRCEVHRCATYSAGYRVVWYTNVRFIQPDTAPHSSLPSISPSLSNAAPSPAPSPLPRPRPSPALIRHDPAAAAAAAAALFGWVWRGGGGGGGGV